MYLNKLVRAKSKKVLLDEGITNYFYTVIFNLGNYEEKISDDALFRLEKVTTAHNDVLFIKVEQGSKADFEILDYLLSKEGILVKDVKINKPYFLVLKTKDLFKECKNIVKYKIIYIDSCSINNYTQNKSVEAELKVDSAISKVLNKTGKPEFKIISDKNAKIFKILNTLIEKIIQYIPASLG